ncbi:ATP-binding protein [Bradyrhizobium sp. B124]|uniref:AlbA family DNA-binding domain-containing protein n=1 Tax=Bradyrhizobium sp. B124 TaxID=3140245 RepID=UPI003183986A
MNTEELEIHIQGAAESPTLDFKAATPWDVARFAKDILAFSNVQDGGIIIVGIEDATFVRQGITEPQRNSYKIDIMRDQMTSFADPHVNFSVDFPTDQDGKQYVCIRVEPFEEIPVICRKDSADTRAGVIYYRNRNRRVESASVSNSYDMREIVEVATVRMMQKKERAGFSAHSEITQTQSEAEALAQARARLDQELEGL